MRQAEGQAPLVHTGLPRRGGPGETCAETGRPPGLRRATLPGRDFYLIGGGLSRAALATVGQRPLVQGFLLWNLMASATLGAIVMGWIS